MKLRKTIKSLEEIESTGKSLEEIKSTLHIYNVILVHIEEFPFSLWGRREDDIDLAEFVAVCLAELGDELVPLDSPPHVDQVCVSQYFIGRLQRVHIIALDDATEALVHFIDYGRYTKIPCDSLYKLPDELVEIPPLVCQIFLPVKILPGRESGAVLAVAEAALHTISVCVDLNHLTMSNTIIYSLVSAPGIGDLGDHLVNNKLALPLNWEYELGLHIATDVKKMLVESVKKLYSEQDDQYMTDLAKKIDDLTRGLDADK